MAFNFNQYKANNPLLQEYISDEEFDYMKDDELDAAEEAGELNPSDEPIGPNEASNYPLIGVEKAAMAAKEANIDRETVVNIVNQTYGQGMSANLPK